MQNHRIPMLRLQRDARLSLFLNSRNTAGIEEKVASDQALTLEIRVSSEDVQM